MVKIAAKDRYPKVTMPEKHKLLKESGRISAVALKETIDAAKPGVTLIELEQVADSTIQKMGGKAAFKTVSDYYWATCLNINDEVVHGIPRNIALREGDVLKIDVGASYKGWFTDTAWTVIVSDSKRAFPEKKHLLAVGEEALWKSIDQAKAGNHVGDISYAIQSTIEKAGFSVVKSLSGHGVGREVHEEPEIPEFGIPGEGLKLEEGMILAIEAIYAAQSGKVYEKNDGWTIATLDGSLAGLFEMTVVVGKDSAEVLTDFRKV